MTTTNSASSFMARFIRRFALPIVLAWVGLTLLLTFAVPSLERVERETSVALIPKDSPSALALAQIGRDFQESDSDSSAMIVLEGKDPLGPEAHAYYDGLIRALHDDPAHVEHVQDLWGDPLTSSGMQSPDDKAAYVQLNLAGDQGTPAGEESLAALHAIVGQLSPPAGVDVFVTGAAPLMSDMQHSGNDSIMKITVVTVVIILTMLLLIYRSLVTSALLLTTVGIELGMARGIIALLGHHDLILLSMFSVNLLVSLGMAAGTDYGIFYFGRYQEARRAGEDPEAAYFTAYRSVTRVVLASGLTIAGALLCLKLARLPYFSTIAVPCAIGLAVLVLVGITLLPAVLVLAGRFGLLDPKRAASGRRWRGIGTAIVRWPAPILVASSAVLMVGLLALSGYQTSYNDRNYLPDRIPANEGFQAAERHFSQSRLMPDVLLIQADHDLRNPTDFLVLNKIAKSVFRVHGVSLVQGITRPEGTPIERTSIPFLLSLQTAGQSQSLKFQQKRNDDMLIQAADMTKMIAVMEHQYAVTTELANVSHRLYGNMQESYALLVDMVESVAAFDDAFRPLRSYFYWEPHCYNIPICWSTRAIFDVIDMTVSMRENLKQTVADYGALDALMPQMVATFPKMITFMKSMRSMVLTMHSTMTSSMNQIDEMSQDATEMGRVFDEAKSDESFYLPPEVFKNKDFQRAMKLFLSPDGKAVRFIISHRGDPATPEGIKRVDAIKTAAEEAVKGTPLGNSQVSLAGAAATAKDWQDGSTYDLLIAGIAALCLIFIIMLIITRSLVAALVIVGTVALSLGASFGLSVLVWQHILGIDLHWMVLAMSVIILLAVGSDYNLLLVSRMKEELSAGINTGIIRAMGGSGKVVSSAGLVFGFTMMSMVVSDLRIIGQVGTTIGLGLLVDTFIVRSFITPSIAALLGRWFWWPQRVRPRPASFLLRDTAPRPVVRELLLGERPISGSVQ